uniref:Uncharacterized protein n=1 Tax=Salix viminalis TaxID=40686 RepID=A0A6N2KI21_SALVM
MNSSARCPTSLNILLDDKSSEFLKPLEIVGMLAGAWIKNATEERNVATKGDGRIDMASRDVGTADPCPANTRTKVLMNSATAALNALE